MVARELELRGWTIVDRNWRGGGGELDLVVSSAGCVRFVEVKARGSDVLIDNALEAITHVKRARLVGAAEAWMLEHAQPVEVCFMVVVVDTRDWSVELFDDAFDG